MIRNLGTVDRIARLVAALPLVARALLAPFAPLTRAVAFGVRVVSLVATALGGLCLGYAPLRRLVPRLRAAGEEHLPDAPGAGRLRREVATMFASNSLAEHLPRGALGAGAFAAAVALAPAGWPPLLLVPLALVASRGCPLCWLTGLVQTLWASARGRRTPGACADGRCALERRPDSRAVGRA
jgi:hypothetical protein